MGMGEPSDNAIEVNKALKILTDVELYHMAKSKVTVSTVAPTPKSFALFADSPCALAWSVHAANDELRRKLVPTNTRYTMVELRQGLIDVLLERNNGLSTKRMNTLMLEVVLIKDMNDSKKEAEEMAEFVQVLIDEVPGLKMVVNLIPFNSIDHSKFRKPTDEAVKAFQNVLWDKGIYTHIRTTRGDDESAACGQLSTKKMKKKI